MANDKSVLTAIVIPGVGILLSLTNILPASGNNQPWYIIAILFIVWLSAVRLMMILPVQTLVHAVKNESKDNRVKWLFIHLFLWPAAGIAYYFSIEKY